MYITAFIFGVALQFAAASADDQSPAIDIVNANTVELLVVPDAVETAISITPDDIGAYACRLKLSKDSSQWALFERVVASFPSSYAPSSAAGEVRVGVIFRDAQGKVVRAIFAQNPRTWKSASLIGSIDGKTYSIPRAVAEKLRGFATDHKELADTPDARTAQLCNALS